MKLLDYPFRSIIALPSNDDAFSLRVLPDIHSKLITAASIERSKTYILLEITNTVTIKGITNIIYEYGIVDFYIPPEENATEYFSDFYNVLMSNDDYNIRTTSDNKTRPNDISLDKLGLFYPAQKLTLADPLQTMPFYNLYKNPSTQNGDKLICDWDSDQVPMGPDQLYIERFKTGAQFQEISNFLTKLLDKQPIICKSLIIKFNFKELGFTQSIIFAHLPIFAYYSSLGPWPMCWIKYGYDPRTDYTSYKYQRLGKFRLKHNFLLDFKEFDIIKNNEERFINKKYDKELGFFKMELIRFLKRRERHLDIKEMVGRGSDV